MHRNPLSGLLIAQFFGAFNDNAFKMIVALLAIAAVQSQGEAAAQGVTTLAFVVLTLPLMAFSLPAMVLGDRWSKRTLIVATKALEVVLMTLGTVALWLQPTGWMPLAVLGGMGAQSALFAPAKYGILPEVLPHDRLSRGNALLELASFVAIILGTVAGGLLVDAVGGQVWIAGAVLLALSVVGMGAALRVPPVSAAGGGTTVRETVATTWRDVRGDRVLWLATLGSIVFWCLASLLGQDVLIYSKAVLEFSDTMSGLPYALFAIGVGAGSVLAGRLSRGKVETGLIPLGALGLGLGTALLGLLGPGRVGTFALMSFLGLSSGLVVVPLNAAIQWRAPAARRGAVIALVNGLSFGGILVGNLGCLLLAQLGCGSQTILVVAAVLTLAGTVWAVRLLPEALLRLCVVMATNTLYRLRIVGARNVPETGGALLVPNHVSFLDALFLLAATDRPIRFVVDQYWYERPYLKPFLASMRAIPITTAGGPRSVLRALREAGVSLDQGELVCLFAEGEISRTGSVLPFRRGMQRLVKGRSVPIVPVHLDRVYGGLLSVRQGRVQKLPQRLPCPVTVSFGAPVPAETEPATVRRMVDELAAAAWQERRPDLRPLHCGFLRSVRRAPWALAFADSQGRSVSRLRAAAGAIALARRLQPLWGDQRNVGLLLPPSIGGALATIAASLSGRTSVPLNYTTGAAALASAVRQAGLRTIVTSREFVAKLALQLPAGVEPIWIEEILQQITGAERRRAAMFALFRSMRALERACGARARVQLDDPATILFSSGSTGEPKGVVLSHYNIQSNCTGTAQVLPLEPSDRLLGVLPLFHSFGNMALWYASQQGAAIVFHPNPLDAAAIGDLVALHRITVLIATPTFLQIWMRRCEPGQFGSLRIVLTGAEKLSDSFADSFADRFGIRPVQGYGTTECSPVVAVSTDGFRAPGFYQAGSRRGSVGRPLPGVVVRIVDVDSKRPVKNGEPGLVLVRGPNVMQGYLGRDDLTQSVLIDGCYVTGDVGRLDDEGFLYLTDRLARFSKIGGEMVPHGTVEEHLQECSGRQERAFAVCGVPDERKGERLMVLTTLGDEQVAAVLAKMATRGLPALFVPRKDQFVPVAALPLLGTGKLDLAAVKRLCEEAAAAKTTE